MSSPAFTVRASEPISLATDRLEKAHISGLIVVDGEWPVGFFSQREALAARDLPRSTPVEEGMTSAMLALEADTPLHRAAAQAAELRVRRVIAVRSRNIEGILSGLDFARSAAI
jgi:CBS domain-containing protein